MKLFLLFFFLVSFASFGHECVLSKRAEFIYGHSLIQLYHPSKTSIKLESPDDLDCKSKAETYASQSQEYLLSLNYKDTIDKIFIDAKNVPFYIVVYWELKTGLFKKNSTGIVNKYTQNCEEVLGNPPLFDKNCRLIVLNKEFVERIKPTPFPFE